MNILKTMTITASLAAPIPSFAAAKMTAVLETYSKLADYSYQKAVEDAESLNKAIGKFAKSTSQTNFDAAKKAWLQSRESYGLTEAFRLADGPIDAEAGWVADMYGSLEGQLNAWPLDESMIDYTLDANGKRSSGNIIDAKGTFTPSGAEATSVNVKAITVEALTALNENGGDANVASGYHAIEFLLWGQDQDYNNFMEDKVSPGALTAGQRPLSDFKEAIKGERRLAFLKAASEKILGDLKTVHKAWQGSAQTSCPSSGKGCYRSALLGTLKGKDASKNIPKEESLTTIIKGLGVFIKSELANERIAVAVLTPSEEDEQSCFSDNTHRDITSNYHGFLNVLKGSYKNKKFGTSLYSQLDGAAKLRFDSLIKSIDKRVAEMNSLAEKKWHFDHQIMPGNNAKELRKMKNDMRKLGNAMVDLAKTFKISINKKDVTDAEETKI